MESPGPAETGRRGADEHIPYSREYLGLVPLGDIAVTLTVEPRHLSQLA